MFRLLFRLGIRPLCLDRRRSSLSVAGVALGVTLLFSIHLATGRAENEIAKGQGIRNTGDLEIVSRYGTAVDDRVYAALLQSPHTADMEFLPMVSGPVTVGDAAETFTLVGTDLVKLPYFGKTFSPRERDFFSLSEGTPPVFIAADTEGAILPDPLAREMKIRGRGGDRTVRAVPRTFEAVVPLRGPVLMGDIGWARTVLGLRGRLDAIEIRVLSGDATHGKQILEGLVPPDLLVQQPTERVLRTQEVIRAFNYNLKALSLMALLVGMFLVYNTVAVSVVRRRPEIGILRALGMTRVQVAALFVTEAFAVGTLGSLIGVAVGALVAETVSTGISATLGTLYDVVLRPHIHISPVQALLPMAWGIGGALVAGLLPALEAAQALPSLAVRSGDFELHAHGGQRGRAFLGTVLVAGGVALAVFVHVTKFPFAGFGGILVLTVGFVLSAGYVVGGLARVLGTVTARIGGAAAWFAVEGTANRPRRTSMAVASIGVSLACSLGILLLTHSFRNTVVSWVDKNLSADVYLKPASCAGRVFCDDTLSQQFLAGLSQVEGVADVYAFRGFAFTYQGRKTHIGFSNMDVLEKYSRLEFLTDRPVAEIYREVLSGPFAVVSEPFSYRFGKGVGDSLEIPGPLGTETFTISAVYRDYSTELGYVILDRRYLAQLFGVGDAHTVGLYFDKGMDGTLVRSRLGRAIDPGKVFFLEADELRTAVLSIFDRTFAVTEGIYLVALAIALLAVVSTFYALVLDRRREIAVLRYLGMENRGLFKMLFFESALVALAGCIVGVVMGAILGLLLVFVINRQSFGWSVSLAIPWLRAARMVGLMGLATLVSVWLPYRGATRLRTADDVGRE